MSEEQIQIESGDELLYGAMFTAENPSALLLCCHPLFEEKKSSHRMLVELARNLADKGICTLLLDYRGCGDSSGETGDFTPDDWVADMQEGIKVLRERFGELPLHLLGIRFGASLAWQVAAENGSVKKLILIDPILKGEDYLQELLQQKLFREMMTFKESRSSREEILKEMESGNTIDLDGVAVTGKLYHGIKAADASETSLAPETQVCLIQISSRKSLSPEFAAFMELQQSRKIAITGEYFYQVPFWKAIDVAKTAGIIAQIKGWIT